MGNMDTTKDLDKASLKASLAALPQAEETDFDAHTPNEWLIGAVPYSQVEISFLAAAATIYSGPE